MNIPFYKCNSKGNDFIIISHLNSLNYQSFNPEKIKSICNYGNKKAVDGFILLNNKKNLKFMDYYNNDGSWETFCLNGIVCCALILQQESNENKFEIISNDIAYKIDIMNNKNVQVQMDKPSYEKRNIKIDNYKGECLDSGARHLVLNYNNEWNNNQKLIKIMKKMRYNKMFSPDGININFYKIIDSGVIQVKTYEKGIEAIMDSCASGSFACAYDYSKKNNYKNKIDVINDGGNSQIIFKKNYTKNVFSTKGSIEFKGELKI